MRYILKNVRIHLLWLLLTTTATACTPSASDAEIVQMCDHLATLRGALDNETMKQQCVAEAKQEKISQRQAQCRIAAVNTQEYWHRCRTGKAR